MIARLTRLALGLASALGGPVVSQGQIACLQPSGCNLAHRSSRELIVVKVAVKPGDTPAKTAVSFVASAGSLSKASDSTDATGTARVIWTGDGSNAQAVVTASALLKDSLHSVTIALGEHYELSLLKPRTRLLGLPLRNRDWYQARQIRDPIYVRLDGVDTEHECTGLGVAFKVFGKDAAVAPDTAWATWRKADGEAANMCLAAGRWQLAPFVGVQTLRYTLVNDPRTSRIVEVKSRALPWVAIGLASVRADEFHRLNARKATIKVTRTKQSAGGADSVEISYDSTANSRGLERVGRGYSFAPVVGVNWPPFVGAKWAQALGFGGMRLLTGADIANPTSSWFLGASLLPLTAGWAHEDVPFDLQVVVRFNRRDEVVNPGACAADPGSCLSETRVHRDYGILVATNAATAFEKILAPLIPK